MEERNKDSTVEITNVLINIGRNSIPHLFALISLYLDTKATVIVHVGYKIKLARRLNLNTRGYVIILLPYQIEAHNNDKSVSSSSIN